MTSHMRRQRRSLGVVAASTLVLGGIAIAAVPQARWRSHVLLVHITGGIPDIDLRDVVKYMLPGSDQTMTWLLERRNPYAVIMNFRNSEADVAAGRDLFRDRCAACHNPDGGGGQLAPSLVGRTFTHGESDWAVYQTIRRGVPNTTMPATPDLSETQRWQLVSFLRFIDVPTQDRDAELERRKIDIFVSGEEIASTIEPSSDWLTYSGSYTGTRHSSLRHIDPGNVHQMAMRWVHQFPGSPAIEATPLVRDGVMFISVPPCSVHALDTANGRSLWTWECELKTDLAGERGMMNRGVALLGNKVYVATSDARLIALDAATGGQAWEATVEEDFLVYYITGAPLAYRDLVVTGISTRQVGRGLLAAFDAETGVERWRFHTVPAEGEPGNDTWAGESWRVGGGPTWLSGSYDPQEDLLYWGVGNPKPDYDTEGRAGDNLYTNSVVALRGTTGELVWHFQFVPGDDKDWGANQIPVLVDRATGAGPDKQLLWANRNGFYYILDRITGKYRQATPFVYQNWTPGIDATGRPLPLPEAESRARGDLLFPGNSGGTHWSSPTYYPARDLMIVPVLEQGMVYFPSFSSPPRDSGRSFYTAVRALDASTGQLVWEHRRKTRFVDNFMPGLASTASGLVFGSDQTTFFALDAESGRLLWSAELGGHVIAAPIVFAEGDREFVTIAGGSDLFTFSLPDVRPVLQ